MKLLQLLQLCLAFSIVQMNIYGTGVLTFIFRTTVICISLDSLQNTAYQVKAIGLIVLNNFISFLFGNKIGCYTHEKFC